MPLDSVAQFVTVVLIFLLVLFLTWFATRWIAQYQQVQNIGTNLEVIETYRLSASKYVQILRTGSRYVVIAVCKDTVTKLTELSGEELQARGPAEPKRGGFQELLEQLKKRKSETD